MNTDHLFTGQTQDAAIGLYWYNSRAYDPAIGRFTQPDTMVPDPKNPQALNRYAYGLNSPVRLKDPTGHYYDDPSDGGYGTAPYGGVVTIPSYIPWMGGDWSHPSATSPIAQFVNTPREAWANLSIGVGTTIASLGRQPSLRLRPVFGKVAGPDHWEAIPEPTRLGKVGRVGGIVAGAAFMAVDEADVVHRYNTGTLTNRPDKGVAFLEDSLVVLGLGAAGVAIGVSSAPVWAVVGAGIALVALGGGLRYEIEHGDFSLAGFGEGVKETFSF